MSGWRLDPGFPSRTAGVYSDSTATPILNGIRFNSIVGSHMQCVHQCRRHT